MSALTTIARALKNPDYAMATTPMADGIAGACQIIDVAIMANCVTDIFGCPPVAGGVKDTSAFWRGRADYLLFHRDGSSTVIEVVDDRGERVVMDGIGRLYQTVVAAAAARAINPAVARLVLATNCADDRHDHIATACAFARTRFVRLGTSEQHRQLALGQVGATDL